MPFKNPNHLVFVVEFLRTTLARLCLKTSYTKESQVSADERHPNHPGIVFRGLFEAREYAAILFQPTDEAFDDVTLAVGVAVPLDAAGFAILVALAGDHWLDAGIEEVLVDPLGAITFVASQRQRCNDRLAVAAGEIDAFQERFQSGRFVSLSWRQMEVEGVSVRVAEEVDLRRKAAPAAAESVILGFLGIPFFPPPAAQRAALTMVPSMHHRSESTRSASICAAWRRFRIWLSRPWEFQASNSRQTVWKGPNSPGKSLHGEPVRRIHKMPSRTSRRSFGGRPVAFRLGKRSLTHSHASSERRLRAMAMPSLAMWSSRHEYDKFVQLREGQF